ncbi:MAG: hypothetical protein WC044_08160 [Crocinitomicaceae bacterium]
MYRHTTFIFFLFLLTNFGHAQAVPAPEENIPFLVTFGNKADTDYGDDDFTQIFFFVVPKTQIKPIYIRVFDAEVGGKNDELNGAADTKTTFSFYGGKGCITEKDARSTSPNGNYKSGNLLKTKTFGVDASADDVWTTFGPFNPNEGELEEKYGGYIFKVIAQGNSGNDGNLYRYFMSSEPNENRGVEGGNAFTFEYCFRLHTSSTQVSHIYPYIDEQVISLKQSNFDWDNDGQIRIVSVAKKGDVAITSGDNQWATGSHKIVMEEKGKSLDVQFVKKSGSNSSNNNVVFYITNQYGESLPFFAIPIGGVPIYKQRMTGKPKTTKK